MGGRYQDGQTTSNTTVVTDRLNNRRTSAELMPKTRDASVSILGTLPMPYYNSLRPKTVNDVFDSPSCSIAVMNKEFGETHLRGFMVKVLDLFNVGKSIGAVQVAQTVDLIIDENL
ncbi:MAG: hypothetical protein V8T16_17550 [Parabacteroides merdae]